MIATLFLQYAAVANRPRHQPIPASLGIGPRRTAGKTWLGIGVAVALHLAWLTLMPEPHPKTATAPPQPIMVNWVNATPAKTPVPPAAQPLQQPQRPVKTPKPKPVAKTPKPKPILAATSETVSAMAVPNSEPEPQKSQPAPAADPQPAATATAANNAESSQAPTTLPSLQADYLHNPAPVYPEQSRQQGEQGRVLVRVLVTSAGNVEQVNLRKSSGYAALDSAALETVKNWRFVPAHRGSQVVSAWVVVPISFSLEG
ncbi:TonB family protein [Methylomonas methanica MC09]|uniref:TonB family protein n=2 Tax=Methylomonas methanica TaxID=421 RepID=G0A6B7_METMM|nr:TonB family protein [Methylomonas methanica MC09]